MFFVKLKIEREFEHSLLKEQLYNRAGLGLTHPSLSKRSTPNINDFRGYSSRAGLPIMSRMQIFVLVASIVQK